MDCNLQCQHIVLATGLLMVNVKKIVYISFTCICSADAFCPTCT